MKKLLFLLLLITSLGLNGQVNYTDFFSENTLRFDYNRCGTSTSEQIFFQQMVQEGAWSGPRKHLADPFLWGEYRVELRDKETGKLIYSRGYAGLYSEWQTTAEAKQTSRCFYETVRVPFPKEPVTLTLFSRDRTTKLNPVFKYDIDPTNYLIKKETGPDYKTYMVHDSGDPKEKIDIVFLPDGFTTDEMGAFRNAVEQFSDALLKTVPFDKYSDRFNVWLVDFDKKWKGMVKKRIPIPTPRTPEYQGVLGAFEGGLYVSKGVFSPMQKCKMNWLGDPFCPVCEKTIVDMIKYYTE